MNQRRDEDINEDVFLTADIHMLLSAVGEVVGKNKMEEDQFEIILDDLNNFSQECLAIHHAGDDEKSLHMRRLLYDVYKTVNSFNVLVAKPLNTPEDLSAFEQQMRGSLQAFNDQWQTLSPNERFLKKCLAVACLLLMAIFTIFTYRFIEDEYLRPLHRNRDIREQGMHATSQSAKKLVSSLFERSHKREIKIAPDEVEQKADAADFLHHPQKTYYMALLVDVLGRTCNLKLDVSFHGGELRYAIHYKEAQKIILATRLLYKENQKENKDMSREEAIDIIAHAIIRHQNTAFGQALQKSTEGLTSERVQQLQKEVDSIITTQIKKMS